MGNIIRIAELESTNQYLANLVRKEAPIEGTVVIANFQTAGKGQGNNSWEAEAGKNLTFSMVLYPKMLEAQHQFILSQLVSLAIIDTLKSEVADTSIKWPNDIYVGNKKIAGILIENVLLGKYIESCIIGIGLNVNQVNFCSNAPNPVSLKQLTGKDYDLSHLLKEICGNIFVRLAEALNEKPVSIFNAYFSSLYKKDNFCTYQTKNTSFMAKITAVLPTGELVVEKTDGSTKTFGFKEIELLSD